MKPSIVPNSSKAPVLCHRFTIVVVTLAAAFLSMWQAVASPIPVEPGPDGIVHGVRQVSVVAPNVQFEGQSIDLDFRFDGGQFIRLFTQTTSFQVDVFFEINNAPRSLDFAGSGYLTDINGDALGPVVTLQAFEGTDWISQIGVDLLLLPLTSDVIPGDAYGFHLDLRLPNSPGFGFVNSPTDGGIVFDANVFGVGPGVPVDVVPEPASSWLLALGLVSLILLRIRFQRA